jgi:UDP-N-acetylmuramoylalanine--D-glutamate ligase
MAKLKVGVIFGGMSSEREISLATGRYVYSLLDTDRFEGLPRFLMAVVSSNISLKGKRVTVLGLGTRDGGVGVVKFLVGEGARVLISDLKNEEELPSLEEIADLPVKLSLGGHHPEIFETDLIVRNPAVPHTAEVLREAERRGIPVVMESTLFAAFCPSSKVIGITGTKGKTTTTLLLEKALQKAGEKAVAAGNLCRSMLGILPQISSKTWVVLELSSFQLEGLEAIKRSPYIAVITNFFPDHLNRYQDMEEYAWAKSNIFKYQHPQDLLFFEKSASASFDFSQVQSQIFSFSGGASKAAQILFETLGLPFDRYVAVKPPYRLELVGEKRGVCFVNDSCAANPGATLFALDRFRDRVVLITGGTDKNLDYSTLSERINELRIPVVLLSGSATEKFKNEIREELVLAETKNLSKAVRISFARSYSGGTVLFSPAAASFELFDDEFDRGEKFNKEVEKL